MHPLTQRLVRRTPRGLRGGVELVARTVDDTINDRVPGLAAEIAFWVLLSVPPLLLTVLAMARPIGRAFDANFAEDLRGTVETLSANVFTTDTINDVVLPTVDQVLGQEEFSLGVVSILAAVWAASRAVKVVLTAITEAYDLEVTRAGWRQRLRGLGLTLLGVMLGLVVVPALVAGPELGEIANTRLGIEERLGLDVGIGTLWRILYWPGVVGSATLLVAALYHVGAPWETPFRRDLPGAALAMALWVAGSLGLRLYTTRTIVGGDSLYGPIAGPVVLLIWIYVSAFAVLLGAELNAEIEKMWPVAPQKGPDPVPDRIVAPGDEPDAGDPPEDEPDPPARRRPAGQRRPR